MKMTIQEFKSKGKIRSPRQYPEDDLQMACIEWFDLQFPKLSRLLIHVPNQRKQDKIKGARLKKMGVRPGVSDLILLIPKNNSIHGLCIEMKSEKGKLSENQVNWLNEVANNGYMTCVCNSFESFKNWINSYLKY
jgi:hypothetical protein